LPPLLPEFTAITFLRHPVARFLSHYRYINQEASHPQHEMVKHMTLSQWMDHPLTHYHWSNHQVRFLTGYFGREITSAHVAESLAVLEMFAVVGIVEEFTESIRQIEHACNLSFIEMRHDKRTEKKSPYTPAEYNRMMDMNAADMALYNAVATNFESERIGDHDNS
jgi:hypothetical protein